MNNGSEMNNGLMVVQTTVCILYIPGQHPHEEIMLCSVLQILHTRGTESIIVWNHNFVLFNFFSVHHMSHVSHVTSHMAPKCNIFS